jgi:hypothetical protein
MCERIWTPPRIAATDQPIRLDKQFCFQRRRIPHAGSNEVVQLIVVTKRKPIRHRRNALAIARADQLGCGTDN